MSVYYVILNKYVLTLGRFCTIKSRPTFVAAAGSGHFRTQMQRRGSGKAANSGFSLAVNASSEITRMKPFQCHVEAITYSQKVFGQPPAKPVCLHRSVVGIEFDPAIAACRPIALVLTSPPYPGVHVLYHRWQVQGRRETPAPFWIASSLDGNGASYYTFGDRKREHLDSYFDQAFAGFRSLASVVNEKTLIVQMVAFSEPQWQLPRYLDVMERAGLKESKIPELANKRDGRVWREVPNRKWYASQRGVPPAATR